MPPYVHVQQVRKGAAPADEQVPHLQVQCGVIAADQGEGLGEDRGAGPRAPRRSRRRGAHPEERSRPKLCVHLNRLVLRCAPADVQLLLVELDRSGTWPPTKARPSTASYPEPGRRVPRSILVAIVLACITPAEDCVTVTTLIYGKRSVGRTVCASRMRHGATRTHDSRHTGTISGLIVLDGRSLEVIRRIRHHESVLAFAASAWSCADRCPLRAPAARVAPCGCACRRADEGRLCTVGVR
mmetsp:Transcript_11148/g.30177  ORF Transcript_11148/g.30177 Transcript_11148/m.30177 type:complete len:241 (-) Transcript_11148:216-938(-)